jgi:hypothetical protein
MQSDLRFLSSAVSSVNQNICETCANCGIISDDQYKERIIRLVGGDEKIYECWTWFFTADHARWNN